MPHPMVSDYSYFNIRIPNVKLDNSMPWVPIAVDIIAVHTRLVSQLGTCVVLTPSLLSSYFRFTDPENQYRGLFDTLKNLALRHV